MALLGCAVPGTDLRLSTSALGQPTFSLAPPPSSLTFRLLGGGGLRGIDSIVPPPPAVAVGARNRSQRWGKHKTQAVPRQAG